MRDTDELADVIVDNLNKINTNQKMAFFLDGDDSDAPTNISGWISTGSSMLDLAISNKPHGGIPVGRITEITGLEQTGKSLLGAHILAETQRKGGLAVLIDTETSVSREFFEAIGIDMKKMVYASVDTIEDIFESITKIIEVVRKSDKDRLVTIVVDSVSGASTKAEMETDFDKDGYATGKAIIISKALRKITNMVGREKVTLVFTNQLRQKLGVMFGDPWTTSGGKALQFHSSVRIRLKRLGGIKKTEQKVERIIGIHVRASMVKNRIGPPMRSADFDVFYESGVDDFGGWVKIMKEEKLISKDGGWYTYSDDAGTEHKFQTSKFVDLLEANTDLKEEIYQKICDSYIMKYKKGLIDPEDLEYDDDQDEL